MRSVGQFFSEYDSRKKTCGDEELEFWLRSQCETAARECPDDGRMIGALFNELGAFYKHRGRLEEAEAAFLKAKEAAEPLQDANYATIVNNLAGNFRMRGNFPASIALFQEAIAVYQNCPETPKEIFSSAYNNLALVYLDTGSFREAAEMLQAAYDFMQEIPGCFYEKATALANKAFACFKCGDAAAAKEAVQTADALYLEGGLSGSPEYQAFLKMKEIVEKQ